MIGKTASRFHLSGFTLIELLVVMAIIAILASIAYPRYFGSIDKAKEAVLRQDLFTMREALDKHYGDRGVYPNSLQELVDRRYLRRIPIDPLTDTAGSWIVVPPDDPAKGGIVNVLSGAPGKARDGSAFRDW